jgi:hypothetical protein
MRIRKLRGGKRRLKQIEQWASYYSNLDIEIAKKYGKAYAKLYVYPWSSIAIFRNSVSSEPGRKARRLVIDGLIKIYNNWKAELDKLEQPYYLKIWLCEPRLSKSQVVAALSEERMNWYENVFTKAEENTQPKPENCGLQINRLNDFSWNLYLDEETYDDSDLADPHQYESIEDYYYSVRWFKKIKKKARVIEGTYHNGEAYKYYKVKMGNLWVGELTSP